MNIHGYDAWKLASPDDEYDALGEEDGQACGAWIEPDEDCPKATQCHGMMVDDDGDVSCDTCGRFAQ